MGMGGGTPWGMGGCWHTNENGSHFTENDSHSLPLSHTVSYRGRGRWLGAGGREERAQACTMRGAEVKLEGCDKRHTRDSSVSCFHLGRGRTLKVGGRTSGPLQAPAPAVRCGQAL
jgi:hypothetical protein